MNNNRAFPRLAVVAASLLMCIVFLGITSPARVSAGPDRNEVEEGCEVAGGTYVESGDDVYGCDFEEGWDVVCTNGMEDCELGIFVGFSFEEAEEPSPETNLPLVVASIAASVLVLGVSLNALGLNSKLVLENLSTRVVLGGGITTLFALIGLALVIFWTAAGLLGLRTAPSPDVDIGPRVVFAEPRVFGVNMLPPVPIPLTSLTPASGAQDLTPSSTLITPTPTITFTPHPPTNTLAPPTNTSAPPTQTSVPPTKTSAPPTSTDTAIPLASISGVVWQDENGSGNQDGEAGYGGVTVSLGQGSCSSTGFKSATSSANGHYGFTALPAGTYCVSVNITLACNGVTYPTTATQYEVTLNPGDEKVHPFGYQTYIC